MTDYRIGIVIPCYNSRQLLKQYLPSIIDYSQKYNAQITIVDDGSSDGSAEFIQSHFGDVNLILNRKNEGFIRTVNRGVKESSGDIAILLNTDIEARSDFIAPVLAHFKDDNVFAVSLKSRNPDGTFREGAKRLVFRAGLPKVLHNEDDQYPPVEGIRYTDYPVGGHCALRISMFKELGGFDDLYSPFYWEDTDLGYRARGHGWKIVYEPSAEVYHHHGVIATSFEDEYIKNVRTRNRILFSLRHKRGLVGIYCKILIAFRGLFSFIGGNRVFLEALRQATKILNEKRQVSKA
ncbi:MAG: glycosyltransferase [candidate division Zixibacteria bacterium]|nr:glycosyltransferase [candidate division Zixibacteria bacterium]